MSEMTTPMPTLNWSKIKERQKAAVAAQVPALGRSQGQRRLPMPRLKVVVSILDYLRRFDSEGRMLVAASALAPAVGIQLDEAFLTLPWMAMHGLVEEVLGQRAEDQTGYRLKLFGPPQPAAL